MELKLTSIHIENFKGVKSQDVTFSDKTRICGANATGKTTVFDAVTWLLFNKNSLGAEKFDLRPIDTDGNRVDHVEIYVSADIEKDGETFTIAKRQKQNWVKHAGCETAEFQGNVNEYEINGYPKAEKDYKAFIAELMDEELFKLLSSPTYFTSLKWQKQREILMKLVQTESDVELAIRLGGFEDILPELKVASTEDITKKYAKTQKELKAQQAEIPVRIDEIEKQKVDYDTAELELQKNAIEEKLAALNGEEIERTKETLKQTQAKINTIRVEADTKRTQEVNQAMMVLIDVESEAKRLLTEINGAEYAIKTKTEVKSATETELKALGDKYFNREKEEYTPKTQNLGVNSEVCPTCGRTLPPEKIEALKRQNESREAELKKAFEEDKAADLKRMVAQGNSYRDKVKALTAEIEALTKQKTELEAKHTKVMQKVSDAHKVVEDAKSKAPDYGPDYEQLVGEASYLEEEIKKASEQSVGNDEERLILYGELEEVKSKIAQAMNTANLEERITELKGELKDVAQKIADTEKILFALDKFIKAKMDTVSKAINGCFEIINVRLFKTLINGGIEECCDITIDGVPFAGLNTGARIVGGLDLIRTLSKIYEAKIFVFIDNAESVNDFNVPKMDSQIIELVVTEDKTLKVEV